MAVVDLATGAGAKAEAAAMLEAMRRDLYMLKEWSDEEHRSDFMRWRKRTKLDRRLPKVQLPLWLESHLVNWDSFIRGVPVNCGWRGHSGIALVINRTCSAPLSC
eukprot:scaffold15270_cov400-Alexandrium_tamarense.AAC.2